MTRRSRVALGALCAAVALLAVAAPATARTTTYADYVTDRIIVVVELTGKGCPASKKCFKKGKAKVTEISAVGFGFPICPVELLESGFEFGDPNTGKPEAISVGKDRRFAAHGGSTEDLHDVVDVKGRFAKKGKSVSGKFSVDRGGCLTGDVPFDITPEK